MFVDEPEGSPVRVTARTALRHLIVFQFKLALDAIRDFFFSPLSVLVFLVDLVRGPTLEKSLYVRLMMLGRRSDRMINLFDEYRDAGHFTIDEAVDALEEEIREKRGRAAAPDDE